MNKTVKKEETITKKELKKAIKAHVDGCNRHINNPVLLEELKKYWTASKHGAEQIGYKFDIRL